MGFLLADQLSPRNRNAANREYPPIPVPHDPVHPGSPPRTIARTPIVSNASIEAHLFAPTSGAGDALSVLISPHDPPPATQDARREWDRLAATNPRLYNGPLLSVVSIDFERALIHARRDTFQRLVVQPRVRTGVHLLAVSALLLARDERGVEHLFLARRGPNVRVYPNQWEFGPSGGVAPPHASIASLAEHDLCRSLAEEMDEEIGCALPIGEPIALIRDHVAFSDDLVFRCDAGPLDDPTRSLGAVSNWEYSEALWLPVPEIPAFDARFASQIIPPTRAMWQAMGWLTPGA